MRGIFRKEKIERFFQIVQKRTGYTMADLRGRARHDDVCRARKLFIVLGREQGWSYPVIGRILDRHYSSIIHLHKYSNLRLPAVGGKTRGGTKKPAVMKVPANLITKDGYINKRVLDGVKQ